MPQCLHFSVFCDTTRCGEHVRLVGNLPELGGWSAEAGVVLSTTSKEWPLWRLESPVVLASLEGTDCPSLEYKYLVANEAGEVVMWEERGNRRLEVSPGKSGLLLEDSWNGQSDGPRCIPAKGEEEEGQEEEQNEEKQLLQANELWSAEELQDLKGRIDAAEATALRQVRQQANIEATRASMLRTPQVRRSRRVRFQGGAPEQEEPSKPPFQITQAELELLAAWGRYEEADEVLSRWGLLLPYASVIRRSYHADRTAYMSHRQRQTTTKWHAIFAKELADFNKKKEEAAAAEARAREAKREEEQLAEAAEGTVDKVVGQTGNDKPEEEQKKAGADSTPGEEQGNDEVEEEEVEKKTCEGKKNQDLAEKLGHKAENLQATKAQETAANSSSGRELVLPVAQGVGATNDRHTLLQEINESKALGVSSKEAKSPRPLPAKQVPLCFDGCLGLRRAFRQLFGRR